MFSSDFLTLSSYDRFRINTAYSHCKILSFVFSGVLNRKLFFLIRRARQATHAADSLRCLGAYSSGEKKDKDLSSGIEFQSKASTELFGALAS
jgi:hypothetical protein